MTLQERTVRWHTARFPEATAGQVALKAIAELGEVADALLSAEKDEPHPERADGVLPESADVLICLLTLCGRYGYGDLFSAVEAKLSILETPGAHPASL